MACITVSLPSLLSRFTRARQLEVEAESVSGALDEMTRRFPSLLQLLFDEEGALREHVLCFHNGENTRWYPEGLERRVQVGDELIIIQAVAGG